MVNFPSGHALLGEKLRFAEVAAPPTSVPSFAAPDGSPSAASTFRSDTNPAFLRFSFSSNELAGGSRALSAHVDEFPNSRTTIAAARVDGTGGRAVARGPRACEMNEWVGRIGQVQKGPSLSRKRRTEAHAISVTGWKVLC